MLHEPALYDGHNISDFRPPYALRPLPLWQQNPAEVGIRAANSPTPCILASQALIRTFLCLSTEDLLFTPVITYTRVAYAVIVLVKCLVSVKASTHLGEIYYEPSLDPASTIPRLIDKLESVMDQAEARLPVSAVFHSILSKIYIWYRRVFILNIAHDADDPMEPMIHLSLEKDKVIASVNGCAPTIGESPEATSRLAFQGGLFSCQGFELTGDSPFDTLITDSWSESPDFLVYGESPFS